MEKLPFPSFLGLLFLACLLIASANLHFLQFRFAGYDLSPLIDAGWRVRSGQVPNRDFICTFPPLLYLSVALAFRTLGTRWLAVTVTGALFSLAITLAALGITALLRPHLKDTKTRWLALVYCGLQMTPLLAVGFPWHSTWTQSAAIYALLATFALLQSNPNSTTTRPETWKPLLHLALAQALLLLAKPNVAWPMLLTCDLALLLARKWQCTLAATAAATALASLALAFAHTSLWTTFTLYSQLTSRFRPNHFFTGIFYDRDFAVGIQHWVVYVLLLPVVVWLLMQLLRPKAATPLPIRALAIGAALATWIGMGTNVEFRLVDAPCLLLGAALLSLVTPSRGAFAQATISAATYTLLLIALFYGFSRARMQEAGVWAEAETCGAEATTIDPFFGAFTSCRNLLSVLDETDTALRTANPPSAFFGPRMEFLYAREHLASPRGLPLWWHPGSSYPLDAVPQIVQAFDQDRPAMLIFLHDDRSYLPEPLVEHMDRDYRLTPHPALSRFPDLAEDPTAHIDVYLRR